MRNETGLYRGHMRTKIVNKKGLVSSILAMTIVFSLFSSTSFAYVDIDPLAVLVPPTVTGSFSVSKEASGSYVEPTNSFDDGNPTYYLITQDPAKASLKDITYNGTSYPLTSVCLTSDISKANDAILGTSIFKENSTVFFDSGKYNDSDTGNMYYRFSRTNLSMIGLYSDPNGEPSTTITKSARGDGMTERNVIASRNIYINNLIFDGQGENLVSKSRGETAFGISGGTSSDHSDSSGFVMKNCIIQNYGSSNSGSSNKNTAFNFYQSSGQHNFENLTLRNMKTQSGYGLINFNQATGNYFKNVSIDGSMANSNTTAIKVESASPYVFAGNQVSNVFTGALTVIPPQNESFPGSFCRMYIQDFGYNVILPQVIKLSDFRYVQYCLPISVSIMGYTFVVRNSAAYASPALPAADAKTAVLDLQDNYWIVRSTNATDTNNTEAQLDSIKTVLKAVAAAGGTVPSANIRIVAGSDGTLDSFAVPDFGDIDVNIVAVASAADLYSNTNLVPLRAGATITYKGTAASRIRLFNFDFNTKAKYTLQEAIAGITPVLTLLDPNESGSISGYPKYATYAPASAVAAKILFATPNTFVNCRFTSLVSKIEVTNAVGKLKVTDSIHFTAQLASSGTNSYTADSFAGNVNNTADDQTIVWYSSDPAVVAFGPAGSATASTATALKSGSVTITAKAIDSNNGGEIEKPFVTFQLESALPYTVTYYGNENTSGSFTDPVLSYLSGDTVTIRGQEALEKDGYTFAGWNTTAAGDGVSFQPGDTLSITDNMELFAVWELIPITPTNTPTAEPTVTVTPSPTAEPTITVTPSPTAEPTITVTPSPTAEPTVTVTPSPTAEPTVTVAPSPTAEPTVTVAPSPTAEPTVTVAPSPTAEPTVTVTPTVSPTPPSDILGADRTITPTPSATPTPSVTPSSTPTPTPTPATGVLGTDRVDNIPKTGESATPNTAFGILALLLSGALLVVIRKRRRHYR